MITSIGQNDNWLKQNLLKRQAQQAAQAQTQQPPLQTSGVNQIKSPNAVATPPPTAQIKTQAAPNSLQEQDNGTKAVTANMPAPPQVAQQSSTAPPPEQMTGATQVGNLNKHLLVKKREPNLG